jgi:hypothetical protein
LTFLSLDVICSIVTINPKKTGIKIKNVRLHYN